MNDMIVWENSALRSALENEQKENEEIRAEVTYLRRVLEEKSSQLLDMEQQLISYMNLYTKNQKILEESLVHCYTINRTPLTWLKE